MSYVDAFHEKATDTIKLVERDQHGKRVYKDFPIKRTFYVDDPRGKHQSIFGKPVTKITCKNSNEFRKEVAINNNKKLFESDLNPIYVCLSDNYLNHEAPKLNVAFYDIEVDMQPFAYSGQHFVKIRKKQS